MFYLLKQNGNYDDYNIDVNTTEKYNKYFAEIDNEIDAYNKVLDIKLGRVPFDTSFTVNFRSTAQESELRQLDFLLNSTTCCLVSSRVSHFFQSNYHDSVRFLNTSIQTADAIIDDYKIMMFTVWAEDLYDKERSSYVDLKTTKYVRRAAYYSDCLQGRHIVVNIDSPIDVLVSEEVVQKLKAQNFVLLGLEKPKIVERS